MKRIQWNFEGGAVVLAPVNQLGKNVTIETVEDGRTQIGVLDHLKNEKSRG
jgi:hypothetical protein